MRTNRDERDEYHRFFNGWRLRGLVRDEGVAGSNPATPTRLLLAVLILLIYLQLLAFLKRAKYTKASTGASCGWSHLDRTAGETTRRASVSPMTCARNTAELLKVSGRLP
jgi:hypothetical protein